MNKRLYLVLPDVSSAHTVMNDLLLAHIEERRMHFLGKYGTALGDLPVAGVMYKTDLLHGMLLGAITGGLLGLLVAGVLLAFPHLLGMQLGVAALFFGLLIGALFGSWVSGMLIGSSTPNHRLHRFDSVFAQDHVLLIVDVPISRVEEIRSLVKSRHPEAEDHGIEPQFSAFA